MRVAVGASTQSSSEAEGSCFSSHVACILPPVSTHLPPSSAVNSSNRALAMATLALHAWCPVLGCGCYLLFPFLNSSDTLCTQPTSGRALPYTSLCWSHRHVQALSFPSLDGCLTSVAFLGASRCFFVTFFESAPKQ